MNAEASNSSIDASAPGNPTAVSAGRDIARLGAS